MSGTYEGIYKKKKSERVYKKNLMVDKILLLIFK